MPQERGLLEQDASGALLPGTLEAKTDNFFEIFFEPHFGQGVPCQLLERTSSSLSFPHFSQ
jgi:hypothetical protein